MTLTSAVAVVILGLLAGTRAFSPFQVADDYVGDFERHMGLLKKAPIFEEGPIVGQFVRASNDTEGEAKEVEEYDFIVVGSGAAGSAIAGRLSEVPEWKVLLLEAGAAEDAVTKVPAMQPYLGTTSYNWQYRTIPQNTSCLGAVNHQCAIGTGRALGGDTATNDMLYTRGDPKDYDIWADDGLIGWCWNSVFPYFKKLEDAYASDLDRKHHSYGGPMHLENCQYHTPLTSYILDAAHELGIKKIDYNGKERLGIGIPQVITKDGRRNSAASVYLDRAYKRNNLIVKTESQVLDVIIAHHTKEVKGVHYHHDGKVITAKAAKEVIISAGAINSAQLLLSSGIGPKEQLEALEVPSVENLNVGHNLKDHVSFIGLNFLWNHTHDDYVRLHGVGQCQNDVVEYLKYGKGPLTTTGLELVAFLQTEFSKSKTHYPDVQFLIRNNGYNQGYHQLRHRNIRKEVYEAVWAPVEGKEGFSIEVVLLHPKSTGYVKLHGKKPFWYPEVNPNSLSDPDDEDVETLLAGVHEALKLVHTQALQKHGVYLNPHLVPECDHYGLNDDYWKCAIRHLSVNSRHLTGTAKMGPKTDKDAVVDQDLKVYGVHNLRVADSSVIPVSISGNLIAVNLMIGEQAAKKIKQDWLKKNHCD